MSKVKLVQKLNNEINSLVTLGLHNLGTTVAQIIKENKYDDGHIEQKNGNERGVIRENFYVATMRRIVRELFLRATTHEERLQLVGVVPRDDKRLTADAQIQSALIGSESGPSNDEELINQVKRIYKKAWERVEALNRTYRSDENSANPLDSLREKPLWKEFSATETFKDYADDVMGPLNAIPLGFVDKKVDLKTIATALGLEIDNNADRNKILEGIFGALKGYPEGGEINLDYYELNYEGDGKRNSLPVYRLGILPKTSRGEWIVQLRSYAKTSDLGGESTPIQTASELNEFYAAHLEEILDEWWSQKSGSSSETHSGAPERVASVKDQPALYPTLQHEDTIESEEDDDDYEYFDSHDDPGMDRMQPYFDLPPDLDAKGRTDALRAIADITNILFDLDSKSEQSSYEAITEIIDSKIKEVEAISLVYRDTISTRLSTLVDNLHRFFQNSGIHDSRENVMSRIVEALGIEKAEGWNDLDETTWQFSSAPSLSHAAYLASTTFLEELGKKPNAPASLAHSVDHLLAAMYASAGPGRTLIQNAVHDLKGVGEYQLTFPTWDLMANTTNGSEYEYVDGPVYRWLFDARLLETNMKGQDKKGQNSAAEDFLVKTDVVLRGCYHYTEEVDSARNRGTLMPFVKLVYYTFDKLYSDS